MNLKVLALAALGTCASFASADLLSGYIDVTGVLSMDGYGDADNVSGVFDIDGTWSGYTNFRLVGIGYDVELFADSPSYLSEIAAAFETTSHGSGVWLTPGYADAFPGTGSYSSSGIIDLVGLGLDFSLDADQDLYVEFFEHFDDFTNDWDGIWRSGRIDLQFSADLVPEPASMAVLGLGALALVRRRRK